MPAVEVSATVAATPETIWSTCFEDMKWESWDPDLVEVKDVSGACENGTTCIFAMKDGNNIPITLSNVETNKSLNFAGGVLGGILSAQGKIVITPLDALNSKVDYSFELLGFVGSIVAFLNKKAVVEGTEGGLANIVKLSEKAQTK